MLRYFVVFSSLLAFSCYKTNVVQHENWNKDPATKESGYQVSILPRQYNVFNGNRFLRKYDDTMWADTENYYSDFSDIKFKRGGPVFISFFNINNDVSYCKGWKGDENVYDGIKWNITFKTNNINRMTIHRDGIVEVDNNSSSNYPVFVTDCGTPLFKLVEIPVLFINFKVLLVSKLP